MALNIQRSRDVGLPDYLETRRQLGLESNFTTFSELINIWPVAKQNPKVGFIN